MSGPPSQRYPAVEYSYDRRFFDPLRGLVVLGRDEAIMGGDRPGASPYHYDEEIILAVNAALAAGRPLLVAGRAGTGKSSLAANIAAQLGWTYHAKVITGATEGRDLLWRFDAVRRLHDAFPAPEAAGVRLDEADQPLGVQRYLERGVLWEAFESSRNGAGSVVLIDEIDKADPGVPDSLLEVLGNGRFTVDETGESVVAAPERRPFVVITTNDERELSRPFRRRCVVLKLRPPNVGRLVEIAETWSLGRGEDRALARTLADAVVEMSGDDAQPASRSPNAAEYLDALRVCLRLGVSIGSPEWEAVRAATLVKDLDVGSGV